MPSLLIKQNANRLFFKSEEGFFYPKLTIRSSRVVQLTRRRDLIFFQLANREILQSNVARGSRENALGGQREREREREREKETRCACDWQRGRGCKFIKANYSRTSLNKTSPRCNKRVLGYPLLTSPCNSRAFA